MIELGELEAAHAEFDKRKARVVVISLEDQDTAQQTQEQFQHLLVIADKDRKLSGALGVIHAQSAPDGGDTTPPTTIVVDGDGIVRWVFRPERFMTRLSPTEVLAALDEHVPTGK
jgi:peroxiredoxin